MSSKRKLANWILPLAILVFAFAAARLLHLRNRLPAVSVQGAVIREDTDLKKQFPIADVEISVATAFGSSDCSSDASGFFWLTLPPGIPPRQPLTLVLRRAGYQLLQVSAVAGEKSYVARMVPISHEAGVARHPQAVIANVDVRYSIKSTATQNVGSVVRTFQAVNKGNAVCNGHNPCSPDGRWKAAAGALSVDAGEGNEFRNARVSCIAGPCPFTRIEPNKFSRDGHTLSVSAIDWSDTATFLLEAEVDRPICPRHGTRILSPDVRRRAEFHATRRR